MRIAAIRRSMPPKTTGQEKKLIAAIRGERRRHGLVYGLIGMALAITFYVTRIINFAQGQMMMATVMVTAEVRAAGYPTWAAGAPRPWLRLRPRRFFPILSPFALFWRSNRFSFGWLVSTLGFAVIVENAAAYIWGPTSQAFPPMFQGTSFHLVDAVVTGQQLLAIVTAAVLTVGFELVRRGTLFGKIGMATAADPEMATRRWRQHDCGRDRRLRRLGLLRGRGRPPDRADNLRQPLSRGHIRHVRFHRDDDWRGNRKTDRGDVRRPFARRLAPKAPTP